MRQDGHQAQERRLVSGRLILVAFVLVAAHPCRLLGVAPLVRDRDQPRLGRCDTEPHRSGSNAQSRTRGLGRALSCLRMPQQPASSASALTTSERELGALRSQRRPASAQWPVVGASAGAVLGVAVAGVGLVACALVVAGAAVGWLLREAWATSPRCFDLRIRDDTRTFVVASEGRVVRELPLHEVTLTHRRSFVDDAPLGWTIAAGGYRFEVDQEHGAAAALEALGVPVSHATSAPVDPRVASARHGASGWGSWGSDGGGDG